MDHGIASVTFLSLPYSLQLTLDDPTGKAWGMTKTSHCPLCWPEWEETLRSDQTLGLVNLKIYSAFLYMFGCTAMWLDWHFLGVLFRCLGSMPGKGRLSWMQWCVTGCRPRMPSPPNGWSGTYEGSLRRSSSELLRSYLCFFKLKWSTSGLHSWTWTFFFFLSILTCVFLSLPGHTCRSSWGTCVSPGLMAQRPLPMVFLGKGCHGNTFLHVSVWCHWSVRRYDSPWL